MSGSVAVISTALALLLFMPQASVSDKEEGASRRSRCAAVRPSRKGEQADERRHGQCRAEQQRARMCEEGPQGATGVDVRQDQ